MSPFTRPLRVSVTCHAYGYASVNGGSLYCIRANRGAIRSVAFSHDGQYLASASDDPFVTIVSPYSQRDKSSTLTSANLRNGAVSNPLSKDGAYDSDGAVVQYSSVASVEDDVGVCV